MRFLWSLPKAAPALLRHLAAYADLAGLDLERTQRDIGARLLASVVVGVSVFFAVLMGCLVVVALTWDTSHRVAAIALMGGGFALVAVAAAIYRSKVINAQLPFLGSVRKEWQEDRVILERVLAADED